MVAEKGKENRIGERKSLGRSEIVLVGLAGLEVSDFLVTKPNNEWQVCNFFYFSRVFSATKQKDVLFLRFFSRFSQKPNIKQLKKKKLRHTRDRNGSQRSRHERILEREKRERERAKELRSDCDGVSLHKY